MLSPLRKSRKTVVNSIPRWMEGSQQGPENRRKVITDCITKRTTDYFSIMSWSVLGMRSETERKNMNSLPRWKDLNQDPFQWRG